MSRRQANDLRQSESLTQLKMKKALGLYDNADSADRLTNLSVYCTVFHFTFPVGNNVISQLSGGFSGVCFSVSAKVPILFHLISCTVNFNIKNYTLRNLTI